MIEIFDSDVIPVILLNTQCSTCLHWEIFDDFPRSKNAVTSISLLFFLNLTSLLSRLYFKRSAEHRSKHINNPQKYPEILPAVKTLLYPRTALLLFNVSSFASRSYDAEHLLSCPKMTCFLWCSGWWSHHLVSVSAFKKPILEMPTR